MSVHANKYVAHTRDEYESARFYDFFFPFLSFFFFIYIRGRLIVGGYLIFFGEMDIR